jgi:hypothetical protein
MPPAELEAALATGYVRWLPEAAVRDRFKLPGELKQLLEALGHGWISQRVGGGDFQLSCTWVVTVPTLNGWAGWATATTSTPG